MGLSLAERRARHRRVSPWEKIAENRIQEAIEAGELTPLSGGPLDLTEYFSLPPALRAGTALLGSAGAVPPEVDLLKSIAGLEREFAAAAPERAREIGARLQDLRVTFRMSMERRMRSDRDH